MKKTVFVILAIFTAMGAYAQQPFQEGTTMANLGIGVGSNLGGLGNARPAISIAVDHGFWAVGGPGVISLGGYVGNTGYRYNGSGYASKWNYIVVGVRGAYHYNGFESIPELDLYGGLMLAYNIVNYSYEGSGTPISNNYGSGLGLTGFVGGRYLFSDNFGVFAELGYGVSSLNVGVTYKF